MTQTTAVRVESILESHLHLIPLMVGVDGESADIGGMTEAAQKIAAEIDALTRERDEATAKAKALTLEVERLRPAAEAFDAWRECDELIASMPLTRDTEQENAAQAAADKRSAAFARARDAAMVGLHLTAEAKDDHGAYHWRAVIERGAI